MVRNVWADTGIFLIAVSAFITFKASWIPGGLVSFTLGLCSLLIGFLLDRFSDFLKHFHL